MRVLVMGSVYPRSSQDVEVPWMRESHRLLASQGCELRVLAPAWKGLKSHEIDGIPVHRFRYALAKWEILTHDEGAPSKMANRPWMQLLAIPYLLSGAWQCLKLCWRYQPHLLHVHWPFPHGLMALPAHWILRIPFVLNFHGAELLLARKHSYVAPLLRWLLPWSRQIFVNSSFTESKVRALAPKNRIPIAISPYGTTLEHQGLPARICGEQERFNVLFVGRHIERKGLDVLLEAAAFLPEDRFEIRIVGEGDLTPRLKQQAQALNLKHVVFTGKLSSQDLQKEYGQAHAFVLPAIVDSKGDTEGLGVVLIEAAEFGLPLVASRVGGIPDVVCHQETGLLVEEKDPVQLAQALKQIAADPHLAQALVRGAQARVRAVFSWPVIVDKMLQIYRDVAR